MTTEMTAGYTITHQLLFFIIIEHVSFTKYIEDIYFFEVNTKYISSSELKTSKFSRVRSTSENFDVFKSRDIMKYIWHLPIKSKFSFYFIQYTGIFLFTKQAVKMQKPKIFENKKFWYHIVPNVLTKKLNTHTSCFLS